MLPDRLTRSTPKVPANHDDDAYDDDYGDDTGDVDSDDAKHSTI